MPKGINPESRAKIRYAAELIATGHSKRMCMEELEKKFGIYRQKAEFWWKQGMKSLKESDKIHFENLRNKQRERLEVILTEAIKKKDLTAATKAVEIMNKMFGIYETKQVVELKDSEIKFKFDNDVNNEDDNENVDE